MKDNIPTLKKMFDSFGKEVEMSAFNDDHTDSAFIEAETYPAQVGMNRMAHPDNFSKVRVDFYSGAFSSHKYLAQTMYHEFVYVEHYINGFIHKMYVKHGGAFNKNGFSTDITPFKTAINLSEVFAYWRTESITGLQAIPISGYQQAAAYLKSKKVEF